VRNGVVSLRRHQGEPVPAWLAQPLRCVSRQPLLVEAAVRLARFYEDRSRPDRAAAWKIRLGLTDLPADAFARP
jgi:hypothetical protein